MHFSVNFEDMCVAEPKKILTTSALSNNMRANVCKTPKCLGRCICEATVCARTIRLQLVLMFANGERAGISC